MLTAHCALRTRADMRHKKYDNDAWSGKGVALDVPQPLLYFLLVTISPWRRMGPLSVLSVTIDSLHSSVHIVLCPYIAILEMSNRINHFHVQALFNSIHILLGQKTTFF